MNCALYAKAIVDGLGKNYANLQAVVKICQLYISELSTVIDSTNQLLIPGAGIMELWRYIPAKIQTLACNIVALNYYSFSHSNIHLLQFNIVHSQFKVHISNATSLGMRHSYSMFNVFIRCTMRYASNAIQHPCFLHFQTISIVCSQVSSFDMQHSCLSMQF